MVRRVVVERGMERNEISEHECRFWQAIQSNGAGWKTSRDLALQAQIAPRTARLYCQKFATLGLVETAEVFPAHRYRLAQKAAKTNAAYVTRLECAAEVFAQP